MRYIFNGRLKFKYKSLSLFLIYKYFPKHVYESRNFNFKL